MAEIQVGELKVKITPDYEDFYANVAQFLQGKMELPANDPLARAIRNAPNNTFIGVKVGDETFCLDKWILTDHSRFLRTYWTSQSDLDRQFRIPWRRRFRIALDRLWWRATGWI